MLGLQCPEQENPVVTGVWLTSSGRQALGARVLELLPGWMAQLRSGHNLLVLRFFIPKQGQLPPCRIAKRLLWGQKRKWEPRWLVSYRGRRQKIEGKLRDGRKGVATVRGKESSMPRGEMAAAGELASPRSVEGTTILE